MERKLSISIALAADSQVVPRRADRRCRCTSRRDVWQMLPATKAERTIVLSTHFTYKAEVLSNLIPITRESGLTAIGRSMALKRHFADSYMLTVALSGSSSSLVTSFIKAIVPTPTYTSSGGTLPPSLLPSRLSNTAQPACSVATLAQAPRNPPPHLSPVAAASVLVAFLLVITR